ncbi:hypothetical protein OIE66_40440 [Nonomuraea sp. NBC_01738]|uniref:hypothetical protein n=1 Tax=Nonomuraea sp. NBC_01738 TaxID=2976003 RepID=UPI002E10DF92|nr:hypothetical protein OIE66_40440 [Nonomuraea sp. NBC_01738]
MLRSHRRLEGAPLHQSDEARDLIYHFFTDAYHLKDWLRHDPDLALSRTEQQALESHISGTVALAWCADVCNGIKHMDLTPGRERIPGKPAKLTSQNVSIMLGSGGTYSWDVTFDGQKYDVHRLADEIVREWTAWLQAQGYLQ